MASAVPETAARNRDFPFYLGSLGAWYAGLGLQIDGQLREEEQRRRGRVRRRRRSRADVCERAPHRSVIRRDYRADLAKAPFREVWWIDHAPGGVVRRLWPAEAAGVEQ